MRLHVLLAVISLSGCAQVEIQPQQCTAAYELGFRDAIMGLIPQDGVYTPACTRNGARLDLASYREGWLEGRFQYENRTPHTE